MVWYLPWWCNPCGNRQSCRVLDGIQVFHIRKKKVNNSHQKDHFWPKWSIRNKQVSHMKQGVGSLKVAPDFSLLKVVNSASLEAWASLLDPSGRCYGWVGQHVPLHARQEKQSNAAGAACFRDMDSSRMTMWIATLERQNQTYCWPLLSSNESLLCLACGTSKR